MKLFDYWSPECLVLIVTVWLLVAGQAAQAAGDYEIVFEDGKKATVELPGKWAGSRDPGCIVYDGRIDMCGSVAVPGGMTTCEWLQGAAQFMDSPRDSGIDIKTKALDIEVLMGNGVKAGCAGRIIAPRLKSEFYRIVYRAGEKIYTLVTLPIRWKDDLDAYSISGFESDVTAIAVALAFEGSPNYEKMAGSIQEAPEVKVVVEKPIQEPSVPEETPSVPSVPEQEASVAQEVPIEPAPSISHRHTAEPDTPEPPAMEPVPVEPVAIEPAAPEPQPEQPAEEPVTPEPQTEQPVPEPAEPEAQPETPPAQEPELPAEPVVETPAEPQAEPETPVAPEPQPQAEPVVETPVEPQPEPEVPQPETTPATPEPAPMEPAMAKPPAPQPVPAAPEPVAVEPAISKEPAAAEPEPAAQEVPEPVVPAPEPAVEPAVPEPAATTPPASATPPERRTPEDAMPFEEQVKRPTYSEIKQKAPPGRRLERSEFLLEADHLLVSEKFDEAEKTYMELMKAFPYETSVGLGDVALARGKTAEAAGHYKKAYNMDPNKPDALNGLGSVEGKQGNIAGARDWFLLAYELDPGYAVTYANLGWLLYAQGRVKDAERYFMEALVRDPMVDAAAAAVNGLTEISIDYGEYTTAEMWNRAHLENFPDYPGAHANLYRIYTLMGDTEKAAKEAQILQKLAPDSLASKILSGRTHYSQGRYQETVDTLCMAAKKVGLDQLSPDDVIYCADSLAKIGQPEVALKFMNNVCAMGAPTPRNYIFLSRLFAGEGDKETARKTLVNGLKINRNNEDLLKELEKYPQ